jgi:ParB family transcriptional regulator, chromosome partitioning protein
MVEVVILLSARSQSDGGKVLKAAAQAYKVDTDAVALKVKQEFAAKEKARLTQKPPTNAIAKVQPKAAKKAKAA